VTGQIGRDNAPVHFDDALFAADLARLPETARRALEEARSRHERDGVPAHGTRLARVSVHQPLGERTVGAALYDPAASDAAALADLVTRTLI
jgi:hypothetical protein